MQVDVCIEHISSLFFGSCNWEVYLDMYGALVIPISIFLVISFSHDYLPHKNKKKCIIWNTGLERNRRCFEGKEENV